MMTASKVLEFQNQAELYFIDENGLEHFVGYLSGPRQGKGWGARGAWERGVEVSS